MQPIAISATVVVDGTYVAAKLDGSLQNILFYIAREHLKDHNLGWNIKYPRSWSFASAIGPHVTLSQDMAKYAGDQVPVKLLSVSHFKDHPSKWVIMHVSLPSKFNCPEGCHISIGQERLGQPTYIPKTTLPARVVVVNETYVAAKLDGNLQHILFYIAREYVAARKLAWNITKPSRWASGIGPRVTLTTNMKQYAGEHLSVTALSTTHFVAGLSKWVVLHVSLPSKFNCPQGCLLSIGQEKKSIVTIPTTPISPAAPWIGHLKTSYQLLYQELLSVTHILSHNQNLSQTKRNQMIAANKVRKMNLDSLYKVLAATT